MVTIPTNITGGAVGKLTSTVGRHLIAFNAALPVSYLPPSLLLDIRANQKATEESPPPRANKLVAYKSLRGGT